MTTKQSLRQIAWRTVRNIDYADNYLLRLVPPKLKRRLLRTLLGRAPALEYQFIELSLEGLLLRLYMTDVGRLQLLRGNDLVFNYLKSQIRTAMTVVDVGANHGLYSALAAKLAGAEGHVHAVEPTPDNLKLLENNVKRNKLSNVTIHPYAMGADSGETTFYIRGDYAGGNSMFNHHLSDQAYPVVLTYQVNVKRLDDLVQGPVDIIKIDVEGGELEVLAGMTRILTENPKLRMVLEWNPVLQEKTGHGPTQLPETLLAHGFTVDIISPFTAPLRSAADIQAILPKVIEQRAHMVDIAAVRG